MKKYPHLAKMGILHAQHIEKFSVNSIAYTDVLRIVYKRPKDSILPESRTYRFPRIQKTAVVDSGKSPAETVMVSDPDFRAAIDELRQIMESKKHTGNVADEILEELRLLEQDVAMRGNYIRELVGKI